MHIWTTRGLSWRKRRRSTVSLFRQTVVGWSRGRHDLRFADRVFGLLKTKRGRTPRKDAAAYFHVSEEDIVILDSSAESDFEVDECVMLMLTRTSEEWK